MIFLLSILEKKGLKPDVSISWDDANPTKTHRGIAKLVEADLAKFVISQNIDGLHLVNKLIVQLWETNFMI